jgi:hypothetical protein
VNNKDDNNNTTIEGDMMDDKRVVEKILSQVTLYFNSKYFIHEITLQPEMAEVRFYSYHFILNLILPHSYTFEKSML